MASAVALMKHRRFVLASFCFANMPPLRPSQAFHRQALASYSSVQGLDEIPLADLPGIEKIEVQPRLYGYREDDNPLTWTDLVQIIEVEQNLAKLSRSVKQQRIYDYYRSELKKEWKSVVDHVLVSKFGLEKRQVPTDQNGQSRPVWEVFPPLSEIVQDDDNIKKVLCLNDFPYHTEQDVKHWCLWKLGPHPVTDDDINEAKSTLADRHAPHTVAFVSWRNPPHLKSLPEIDHVHILCKNTPTASDITPTNRTKTITITKAKEGTYNTTQQNET